MKRLPASYTIEAAYVMAIVLTVLATIILSAYRLHDKTAGGMAVHENVEMERRKESLWTESWEDEVRKICLKNDYSIETKIKGDTVTGTGTGEGWNLEIQRDVYEPEGFLRMLSVLEEGVLNSRK